MTFKFSVGELVITRGSIADCEMAAKAGHFRLPNHFTVSERHAVECPGGVQYYYAVRNGADHLRINEVELVSASEFDLDKLCDQFIAGKIKWGKAEADALDASRKAT